MEKIHAKALSVIAQELPDDKQYLIDQVKDQMASMKPGISEDPELLGFRVGPMVNPKAIKYANNEWTPGKADVLVSSFPKTGTTWTREIVRQLLYKKDERQYNLSKACEMPVLGYLESFSELKFEIVKCFGMERNLWGTHCPGDVLNMERLLASGLKMIYVMRNPKDMLISLKKFMLNTPGATHPAMKEYFPQDTEEFIRKTIKGETLVPVRKGEWYPHHIRSYYKYKNHPNVYFVQYEDLKKDPASEIRKLGNFIDVSLTEEELREVVKKTSFDSMKKSASEATQKLQMFRKGQVGSWKENINDELSKLIDEQVEKDMEGMDIQFTYSL